MKDRLPTKPGRVLITPDDGSTPFYAVMTRADEPTEDGTPLSKANLLKDTTAAAVGLTSDAVPDEVLAALAAKKVNKAGDTMTGRLTIATDDVYPALRMMPKETTREGVIETSADGTTLSLFNTERDSTKNRSALRLFRETNGLASILRLDVRKNNNTALYNILHTGNFTTSSWQLIYSASPSVSIPAMSSSEHNQYGVFLTQSDIEDIICANNYSEIKVIVTLTSTKIYDSSSNSNGASAALAVLGRYTDVSDSCEDGGNFTLGGTGTRVAYFDYTENDGSRKFRTLDDTEYIFKAGANSQNQMAGLITTCCEAVTAKATVKVYAR